MFIYTDFEPFDSYLKVDVLINYMHTYILPSTPLFFQLSKKEHEQGCMYVKLYAFARVLITVFYVYSFEHFAF